ILYKVVDKGSDRARALLGRELCDRAGGDDAAFAEGFVLVAQALCTDTAFETAADCLWRICLPVRGRIDRAHPKAVALLELVAQRSPLARARLALLNLSGRDTRPKHAAKALKTLETLMRERCPEACGALADIYLYGLHGIAANWQKGLACALAGWDLHDQRSMALLVLNRLGETDLPPADSNPVTMDALPELVDFLNARGEPLIGAMQTALQMTPLPGQNRTANPEKAGRTFGWLLRKGIEEMDLSLLRLLARLAARLPQGEAADTAARGAAHLLPCVRMETRDDLAAFAARAAADPLAALRELGGESPAVRAPVRTDKGAERTAQKDAEEKRKARKKERQRRKQGRSKK
ncbi:MAG: hypothetical protein Q4F72_05935, partial [Desulfovibrionaceae bacterium]|nr:hypothetical protein [Desulfovibrionaceae bacterium]